ncbi:insulin-like growth factor-binding protein-like 1 [Styela clava]
MNSISTLVIFCACLYVTNGYSCGPCNLEECEAPPCEGSTELDTCGCCQRCTSQKGEMCGGEYNDFGNCDPDKVLVCNYASYFILPDGEVIDEMLDPSYPGTCITSKEQEDIFNIIAVGYV